VGAKLSIYNLGKLGVNVDANPVQLQDGEFTEAKNWTTDPSGSEGSIRKRPGLTAINSSAGGGGTSVLGAVNLGYTQTLTNTFYAGVRATAQNGSSPSATWRSSTNGTSWSSVTTPTRPVYGNEYATQWSDEVVALPHNNKLYYAGDDYVSYPTASHSAPTIRCYDGVVDALVGRCPYNISIGADTNAFMVTAMALYDTDSFLVACADGGALGSTAPARVFRFFPANGQFQQIGPTAAVGATEFNAGIVQCMTVHAGRIFIGTERGGSGTGQTYMFRVGQDTTWSVDNTFGANYNIHSLASYKGRLFAGTRSLLSASPIIYVRSTVGAWTASYTGSAASSGFSTLTALTVFGDNLYCLGYEDGVADTSERITIKKFDDTSWSTVWTLDEGGQESRSQNTVGGQGLVGPDGALYFVISETDAAAATDANSDGIILRSTNGTTWTEVDTFTNLRGCIGFTRTV